MPEGYTEVDGSVRFGAEGVWIGAYFRMEAGRMAIRRRITPDIYRFEFDQITGVDEIAPATADQQTIEFTLNDGSVVGAQLPPAFVADIVGRLADAPPANNASSGSQSAAAATPPPFDPMSSPERPNDAPTKVQHRWSQRKVAAVAAILLLGVSVTWWATAGRSSEATLPGSDAVGVEFTLIDLEGDVHGTVGDCAGSGGYDDFGEGMDIQITDQDGKIIGSGSTMSLSTLNDVEPEYFKSEYGEMDLEEDVATCIVGALVPIGEADFFKIAVGQRGDLSYSHKEMEENDWSVSLTLGT